MKAKNIPPSGFYDKKYDYDETDGAADPTDCDMLSELSETDTVDMIDDNEDDVDLNISPSAQLVDVLKEACDDILNIKPAEEDMDS